MIYNCTRCQSALAAGTRFCAQCGLGFPAPVPLDAEPGPAGTSAQTVVRSPFERFDPPAFAAGHRAPFDPILGFSIWRVIFLVLAIVIGISVYVFLHTNPGN